MNDREQPDAPLVSVLVPTYNRRRFLREALASLEAQTYRRFEAVVVNDGGVSVRDIVEGLRDERFVLVERAENRGKAASLNEALRLARGAYVAYLDDDDRFYPHHLARLVAALEARPDCGAAYTDLYKVHCRYAPDGSRQVLGKVVTVSRDFDRFFLCYFNHTLHVSLMHRRDLLERTGPYDESLGVLVDWDMTRRLAFYTDFVHMPEVTGEFYAPVKGSDRVSEKGRADRGLYTATTLRIRTTRPPKPWPKMPDLAVVLLPESPPAAAEMVRRVYATTFMPYTVRLPMSGPVLRSLDVRLPNFTAVPTPAGVGPGRRLAAALEGLDADYVAVVGEGTRFAPLWVEDALHAAVLHGGVRGADGPEAVAFALERASAAGGDGEAVRGGGATDGEASARTCAGADRAADPAGGPPPGFVVARRTLVRVCRTAPDLPPAEALAAAGVALRPPGPDEVALRFDRAFQEAGRLEADGNWLRAADLYRRIADRLGNRRWMTERRALALFAAGGRDAEALALLRDLNRTGPTVETLLLEARLHRRADRLHEAVRRLEAARRILLAEKGTPCN